MDMGRLKKGAAALAGAAVRTTRELTDKGRRQMDRLAAERKLAHTQRQLGALVYSLRRTGEQNEALVDKYVEAVREAEEALETITPEQAAHSEEKTVTKLCPRCGAEVKKDATFCSGCGEKFE